MCFIPHPGTLKALVENAAEFFWPVTLFLLSCSLSLIACVYLIGFLGGSLIKVPASVLFEDYMCI